MPITITPERPDSPDAKALIDELTEYLTPLSPPESQHGYSVEKLLARNVAFFVIRSDNEPASCGGLELFGDEYGEIKRMFVRPKFRGQGLGKLMVNHLCNHARSNGVPFVRLETGSMMTDANGLYERMGFYRISHFGKYREDPLSNFYEKQIA
ncbi:MAG: GNAT family N-acetyltransferase [Anaerolineales bacterium]